MTTGKRHYLSKGMGYLNAAGAQARFIVFLFGVLIAYTFILLIFRKMAEILQFSLFFPIALTVLGLFIGIVGALYSHTFVGPLARIRKAVDLMAGGDTSVSLRLRDADDPVLKELVASLTHLSDHTRSSHTLLQDSAQELSRALEELYRALPTGEGSCRSQIENVRKQKELLERALQTLKPRREV